MALWVLACLVIAGYLAVFVEFFVPAGGLIGIAGLGCLVASVVLAFTGHGTATGAVMLAVVLLTAPAVFVLGFRLFPNSFLGKRIILGERQKSGSGYTSFSQEKYADLAQEQGQCLTDLRPSGMARIGGSRHSVVTSGEYVGKGDTIEVIRVEGSRIVVRKT